MTNFAIAVPLAALVALAAWRLQTLTRSGAIAALLVGSVAMGLAGWPGALVLFAFFLPAIMLSRIGRARKRRLTDIGKHGARDAAQVLANGGIATLALIVGTLLHRADLAGVAFAGAFAAAAADTWGTEIGTLVRGLPRHILTGKPLPTGISGGVSVAGTIAQAGGAAVVAGVAMAVGLGAFLPIALAGIIGATLDSVLGATLQERRYCDACARLCETDPHDCGMATRVISGIPGCSNDMVNAIATLGGALVALLLAVFFA
ncbi:MAG: DUF92 domain-containing protein [Vulcanimicrobiaceae bacterium]